MDDKFSVGIDIGGTNTTLGIVSRSGVIHYQKWFSTYDFDTVEALAATIHNDITAHVDQEVVRRIAGIGIGAPVANGRTGSIHNSSNLPWKGIVPMRPVFERIFGCKIAITNDANATAFGERVYGKAKGLDHYAVVTLGTGVGAGIIINNGIVEGYDGNGGEFGHIIIEEGGRSCGCGRKGCLEMYTSARGIVQTALELAGSFSHTSELKTRIGKGEKVESKDIAALAEAGDLLAVEVFNHTGSILGQAIANLVTLLGLQSVFLFGGPVNAGPVLLYPVNESFNRSVIHFYKDKVKIEPSALPLRDAALLGAASLVMA